MPESIGCRQRPREHDQVEKADLRARTGLRDACEYGVRWPSERRRSTANRRPGCDPEHRSKSAIRKRSFVRFRPNPATSSSTSGRAVVGRSCSSIAQPETKTAVPIGTSSIAAAGLEIHIERNAVATTNPKGVGQLELRGGSRWRERSACGYPGARSRVRGGNPREQEHRWDGIRCRRRRGTDDAGQGKEHDGRRVVAGIGLASVTHQAATRGCLRVLRL